MDKEFKIRLGLNDQEFLRKYKARKEAIEKQEIKVPVSLEFDGKNSAISEAQKSVSNESVEIKVKIKNIDDEIKKTKDSLESLQKVSNIDIANKDKLSEAKVAAEKVEATIIEMAKKLQALEKKGDKQGLVSYAKEVYEYIAAANKEVAEFNANTSGKRLGYFSDDKIVDSLEKEYKELYKLSEDLMDEKIKVPEVDTSAVDKAKAKIRALTEEKETLVDELGKQTSVNINTEVNESGLTGQLKLLKERLEGVLNNLLINTITLSPEAINTLKSKIEATLDNITVGIKNKDEINDLLQKIIDIQGTDLSKGISFSEEDNQSISESTKIVHKLGLELKKNSEYIDQINSTPLEIQFKNFDEMNLALTSINSEFKKITDVLSKGIKISKAKKTSTEGIDSLVEKLESQVNEFKIKFQEILNNFTIESINVDPDTLVNLKSRIQDSLREISVTVDYLDPKTPEAIEKVTKIKSEFDELKKLNSALDTIIEKVTQKNELFTEEKTVVSKSVKSELLQLNKLIESLDSINERLEKIRANANVFSTLSSLSGNLNGTSNELVKLLTDLSEANQWVRKNRPWSGSANSQTGELERGGYVSLKTGRVDNLEYYDKADDFAALEYIKKQIKAKNGVSKVGDIYDTLFHTHPIQGGKKGDIGRDGAFSGYIEDGVVKGDAGVFINELKEGVKQFALLSDNLITLLNLSDLSSDKAEEALKLYAELFGRESTARESEWNRGGKIDRNAMTKISDEVWDMVFSKLGVSGDRVKHMELSDFIQGYGVNGEELQKSIVKTVSNTIQDATDGAASEIKLQNVSAVNGNRKIYKKSELASATKDLNLLPADSLSDDLQQRIKELKENAPEWGRKREIQNSIRDYINSVEEVVDAAREQVVKNATRVFEANKDFDFGKHDPDLIEFGTAKDALEKIKSEEKLSANDIYIYQKIAEEITKENNKQADSNKENADQMARQAKAAKELLKYLSQIRSSNIMSDFDVQDILKNITDEGFDKITGNTISSMEKTLNGYKNKKVNTLNFNDEQVNLLKNYNAKIADMDDILTNKISTAKTKEEVIKLISQFYNLEQQAKETWQAIGNNKSEVKLSKIDTLIRRLTIDLKNAGKAPRKLRGEAEALISQLNEIREATIKNNSAMTELDSVRLYHLQNEINRVSVGLQEFRGKGFLDKIKASFTQASAQFIGYFFSLPDLLRYARQIFDAVKEVDSAMIELKKVSNDTSSAVEKSFSNMTRIAKEYGSSISNIISLTANWSRLGYNLPDSQELARVTQLYTNVGDGISSEQASESLISTLQGFKLAADSAEDIVDKFNEVGNNFAISSAGIGEALQRSAASFTAANTSLSQAIALVTATNEVVQDPDAVGTMWTTVSARIRGAKTELEDMGEDTDGLVTSTSKLRDLVKGITGVDIMENETTFKDIYTIVDQIGHRWQDISDIDQAALLEALAGKRQSNRLVAVLNNVKGLEAAYESAENAAGSAEKEQSRYAESINYSLERAKASLEEIVTNILSSDAAKKFVDFGGSALELLSKLTSGANGLGRAVGGIVGALSAFIPKLSALQGVNIDFNNLKNSSGWLLNLRKLPQGLQTLKKGIANVSQGLTFGGKIVVSDKDYSLVTQAVNAYNDSLERVARGEQKEVASAESLIATYEGVADNAYNVRNEIDRLIPKGKDVKASMDNMGIAAQSTTVKFKALSVASKILNTALNMIIGMGVGLLIQGIVTAIDDWVNRAEKTKKAAREISDEIKNMNQTLKENKKLVEESGEEYIKLSKGVNDFGKNISLSEEDYSRYVELSKSMADVFPELIKGYNDLNEPIVKNIESIKELNALLEEQRLQSYNEMIYGKSEENKGKTNFQVQAEAFKYGYDNSLDNMSDYERNVVDMIRNDLDGFMEIVAKYTNIEREGLSKNYSSDLIREEIESRLGKEAANIYDIANNQKSVLSDDIAAFAKYAASPEYQRAIQARKDGVKLSVEEQKALNDVRVARRNYIGESQGILSANQEYTDQMREMLSAFVNTNESFSSLTDEQKSYALTFAKNISGEWFSEVLNDSEANDQKQFSIFASEIVDALSSSEPEIQDAFVSLFNLDEKAKELTYNEYKDFVDGIIQTIINEFGEDSEMVKAFKSLLGYTPTRDETSEATKRTISGYLNDADASTGKSTAKRAESGYSYRTDLSNSDLFVRALEGMSKSDYDFVSSGKLSTDAWSDFNAKVKEAGGLAALEIDKIQDLISEAIKKTGAEIEEDTKTTGSDLIKTLQSQMAPALNALGEAYNAIFNGGESGDEFNMAAVTIAQLESVRSAVESLTSNEEWGIKVDTADVDKLINILGNVNTTAEDAQAAFDDFATSIANAVIPNIEHLTEASYQAGIQALQEMGIVNAEEVLISRIGLSLEEFKEAKEAANAAGINTDGDIKNLSDLNMADIEAQNSLAKFIAEKIRTNGVTIQTSGDIANLVSLVKAAYGTAGALEQVYNGINRLRSEASKAVSEGGYTAAHEMEKAADAFETKFSDTAWVQSQINEIWNNAQVSVDFDGGNAANSAGSSGGGGGGGSDSDSANEFSEEIDWIERRQKALSDALTDIQGMVDFTYADWDTRLAHIGMKYQNLNDQITLSQQAMERYQRAMADVGLDEEYAAKVRAGIIDLETITDESLKNRIDAYQGYYDKYIQYEQQSNDLIRQHIALIQDEIDQIRGKFEDINEDLAHLNTLSDSYINRGTIYQQLGSLLDKRVHTEMQLENVLKEREAIEAKIAQYEGDTNSEGYHDLIKNLKDCDEQAEGFRDTLQEIAKTRFDTVAKQFDRIAESIDHATSRINSLADTAEAQGFYASDEFIKANLAMEEDRRSNLYKKRAELEKALAEGVANGSITKGSDTWNEMNNQIEETTDNIYASTAAIEKYKDELRSWQWEAQDWIRERANRAHDTNDFMIEQLGTDKLFEKNGNWNDSATATQGLHVLNYSMYLDESRKLAEEIKKIDEEMANDPYDVKLIARKEELIDLQREAIRNANDEKEAIRSLVKEGYDTFLDYLQKAIDKRKEALEAEQILYEYEKNVRDQAKQIASYQKQLASLSGDTSEENQLRVQQLNNSLAEAQEQLQETQYEKWVSDQEQMMDEMYNQFDELINERLDNLDRLVQDAVNTTDQNGTKIANTVSQKADSIGVDIRNGFGGIDYDSVLSGIDGDIQTQTSTLNNTLETQGQAIIKAAQDAALSIKGEMAKPGTDDTNYARDDSGLKDVVPDTPASKNTPTLADGAMAYRLYNPNSGQHLITTSASEAEGLVKLGWNREGETLFSPNEGKPVTRLYNPNNGDHLYTTNSSEIKTLKALGWNDEGEAFKTAENGVDVYRLYNPNSGLHHFTTSEEERDHLRSLGWNYEGVAFRSMGKFAKGGTVGKAVKGAGEDGFILARTGEEVLSLDKIKGMQQVLTMFEPLTKLQQKIPNGISTLGGNNVTIGDVTTTLSLPNVTNYEDFVNKAKADPKFERLVQQMTIGNALGQSKLKKYSI